MDVNSYHMVVPCAPFANLIIRHFAFAFRIFKGPFNPKALKLHPCKSFQVDCVRRIRKRYFGSKFFPVVWVAMRQDCWIIHSSSSQT